MTKPTYRQKGASGEYGSGVLAPAGDDLARDRKRSRGIPSRVDPREPEGFPLPRLLAGWFPEVRRRDLAVFCWQMSAMQNAGIPLLRSLEIVRRQTKGEKLKAIVGVVMGDLEKGESLSEALGKHPRVFDPLFLSMIEAGEVGGVMDEMLQRLAEYMERQLETRSRIRGAVAYPAFLLGACTAVVIFMLTFVIPRLSGVFEDTGVQMPAVTVALLTLGEFMKGNFLLIAGAGIGGLVALGAYVHTQAGRLAYDGFRLRVPLLGDLIQKVVIARFSRTLAVLSESGVSLLVSLRIVRDVVGNAVFYRVVQGLECSVKEGESIGQTLSRNPMVPEMMVQMVTVGEETGNLNEMLRKIATFYDKEVDNSIQALTKMLEPMLIVIMTLVVGFMAAAIFVPLAKISTSVS